MAKNNDPIIDTKIPLMVAMGVTHSMTPKQISDNWIAWGIKYSSEKNKLSPVLTVALDTLSTMVTLYDTLMTAINTIQKVVETAGTAYTLALSLVPGVGASGAAKTEAELAMSTLKTQIDTITLKIYAMPQTILENLTNTKVDESAVL